MGRPSKASTIKSKDTLDPYGFEFPEESDAKVKARRVSSMSLKPGKDKGQKTRTTTTTTTRASVPWSAKAKQPQHPTLAAVNLNKTNSVKASDSHVQMREEQIELEFDDDDEDDELPDLPPPTTYATHLNQAEHSRSKKVEKSKPVMPSTKPLPAQKAAQPVLTSTSTKQSAAVSKPIISRQNPFFIDDDVSEEEEEKLAIPKTKKRVSAQSKLKHSQEQEEVYHFSDEGNNKIDEGQAKIQKKDATAAHAKSMRDSKHRVPVPLSPSPPPLSVLSQDSKAADDDSDDADKTFVVDDQSEYGMFGNDDDLVNVVGSKKMSSTKRSNVMQIDGGLEYEEIDVEKEVSDDGDMEYEEAPKKGRGKSRGEVAVGKAKRGRKNTKRKRGGNDEEGDDDGEGVETSFKSRESSGGPSQYELELTEMIQAADGILETVIAERFNALQTLANKNEGDFEDQKSCATKVRRQETTMCKKFHESIESLESSISEKKAMVASFHKEAEATFRANKTQAMGLIEKMNGRVQSIVGQTKVMVEREYDTSRVKEQLAALMG